VNGRWSRVLRTIGQNLVRAARYLGPLLRDTFVYSGRLLADLLNGCQLLWRRWQTRGRPETARDLDTWRASLRARRTTRWAPWRSMSRTRRWEIRAAMLALGLGLLVVAHRVRDRSALTATAVSTPAARAPAIPGVAGAAPVAPPQAIERFRAEIPRVSAGKALYLSEGPVLAPGSSERWNGFRVGAPAVLRDGDAGFRMWYRGCRLHGIDHDCAIGHATSADGLVWTTSPEPVLVPSEGSDGFDLGSIAVVRATDTFFMWYSLWPDEFGGRSTSELFLATSQDGMQWTDHGRVLKTTEPVLAVQPSALHDGEKFHLWFVDDPKVSAGRTSELTNTDDAGPFLRHLTSVDGRAWNEVASFGLAAVESRATHVSVLRQGEGAYRGFSYERSATRAGDIVMRVGLLTSTDGNSWHIESSRRITTGSLGQDIEQIIDATGWRISSGWLAWFVSDLDRGREDVRVAFFKE
jgi:hypothetical protein